jgi:hypothetical protein
VRCQLDIVICGPFFQPLLEMKTRFDDTGEDLVVQAHRPSFSIVDIPENFITLVGSRF